MLTLQQASRIKEDATQVLEDKITIVDLGNSTARLFIRDLEFNDAKRAAKYIEHIAMNELPQNFANLIG